jgi:small conductance mechanosensitive channel
MDLTSLNLTPATFTSMALTAGAALLTFVIGYLAARWVDRLAVAALRRSNVDEALASFLGLVLRYTILFATVIATADTLGFDTNSALAIFASAGLAVGLALQGSLGQIASGVMILFNRPLTVGDFVEAGGEMGTVKKIGLFNTEISSPDGIRKYVPNGAIAGGTITNYNVPIRRGVVSVGVDYGSDIQRVREVLQAAVASVDGVLDEPEPAVVFVDLGGSSLDWQVRVWGKQEEFWPMVEAVRTAVYDHLNEAGIGIPFPQMDVHVDGKLGG